MSILQTDQSLKKDDKYTLKPDTTADDNRDDYGIPKYMERLKLTEEQEKRVLTEIRDELDAIKKERNDRKLEQKWNALDNQYEGIVADDDLRQFNLCRRVTKIKCDAVERLAMKAFWKSDPKFSISARPEFDRQGGREICQSQEDFLDYKIDNCIPFIQPERQTLHSAVVKGTGIKKWFHELKREKKKRPECYDGSRQQTLPPQREGEQPIVRNLGLEDFLKAYPDAPTEYPNYCKKLADGKKVELIVEYEETIYNDPLPTNVALKDFYVRVDTEGYQGLCETRLIAERINRNWWQLKKLEKQKKFYNIDELLYADSEAKKADKKKANYANEKFDILECTFYFKLKESDEEETKVIIWVAEEKWIVVGAIIYPYYAIPCIYNPKHIANIWSGFYQPGLAEYLTDNNIAENAILNFTLEGALAANTITPIADRDNPVHAQFMDKRWTHGVPIETKDGKPVDFLNKYIGGFNHTQLLTLLEYLSRDDGSVVGVNDVVTGQESHLDPNAPAAKTLALLQQSGINIEDFIDTLLPSAARDADIILQLYYQMSEEGGHYRPKPGSVNGNPDTFKMISRQDMIARTNIESRAKAFNFDEANEKTEDVALYQLVRQEPLISRNPQAVWKLLNAIIKGWSKKWRNLSNELLPPLEQFQQEMQETVARGVAAFLAQKLKDAQAAGQEGFTDKPPVIVEQLMAVISDLTAETATPPSPEVQKEREKAQKEQAVPA